MYEAYVKTVGLHKNRNYTIREVLLLTAAQDVSLHAHGKRTLMTVPTPERLLRILQLVARHDEIVMKTNCFCSKI